ncbi:sulfatase [Maribacter algarum]|uniref:Sulfatase n=1 Tax=Maribacter algarum (ex Zhang et al. 2020) TaxID=2578118 RepID=A0A5S3PH22_9FLAO|nr:sulfatase [Maribacter algarum]TMM53407.1 sulfatase [Maribacter algarum]
MKNLKIPFFTYVLLFSLIAFVACKEETEDTIQEQKTPNIVWLVSEDNSKHFLKLYEEGGAPMPNIESLAEKGIVFNNAFSNAPVCSVARSTIISGCYAPRVGSQYHRRMEFAPLPDGLKMFPEYLRKAGYYTSNNAKEDYNFVKSDSVWDDSSKKASYRNREQNQPFFHVQNFHSTHEGQLHFTKAQMDSLSTKTATDNVPVFPYHPDTPTFRYTNAHYRDLHQKVDAEIGEFINQLEEDGLMENTIVFYYGDHGGVLPRSKGYIYESGLNVPMVVYVPEKWKHLSPLKMGTRTDAFVQFIDLAPTVLNLAGVEVPEQIDGKAFLGETLSNENLAERNTTFGYADRFDEKYDLVRSIRKGKYKYIRNYQPFNADGLFNFYRYKMLAYKEWQQLFDDGKLNEAQEQFFKARSPETLYDIENDPHEVHNLAAEPSHQSTLLELRSNLRHQVKSMPDLSFYPEPYFIEAGLSNPVAFGQENKIEIAELIDIADLSLKPFDEVKADIKKALNSDDPWKRYWGLIVCSSFGKESYPFFKLVVQLSKYDKNNLVRIRAAEFLILHVQNVPNDLFLEIIKNAKSETETNLILNSIVLIKTVRPGFEINIPKSIFPPEWLEKEGDLVRRRIEFINENKI